MLYRPKVKGIYCHTKNREGREERSLITLTIIVAHGETKG